VVHFIYFVNYESAYKLSFYILTIDTYLVIEKEPVIYVNNNQYINNSSSRLIMQFHVTKQE